MAEYLIPEYKLADLAKIVQKIRNKGANVRFEILDPNVQVTSPVLGRDFTINCVRVDVEGSYRMNGWDFVGTIEHASPENIIRIADRRFDGRVPDRYRTAPKECEHCHIRRDRNDTFLVYNEDEDEFRQVGRTCLKNYTQGLDAEVCASMLAVLAEFDRLNNLTERGQLDDDLNVLINRSGVLYRMDTAKKQAYNYVVANGYVSGQTGKAFADELFRNSDNMSKASDEQVQAVEDWLRTLHGNDWARNALAAWTKDSFERRDAGLITSAVAIYLRHQQEEQARQNREQERQNRLQNDDNVFAGQVGDKVTLTIDSVEVAYYREGGSYHSGYRYPVYRIVGTDGNMYSWGCTNPDLELQQGDVLTGTVKALRELRNGQRCTELTRCKVTGHQQRYRGFFNS